MRKITFTMPCLFSISASGKYCTDKLYETGADAELTAVLF